MSQIELFDYSTLAPDLQVEVKTATERIKLRMKRTAEDIIEIGKDLIAIKEKLPHGQFLPWIAAEFEMSDQTARKFMHVAERFGETQTLFEFSPSTLYLLAAPSTPDEVVEQVIKKAENGETVTAKEVKELKAQLKEKESALDNLKRANQHVTSQLQEKANLLEGLEQTYQETAKTLAQKMVEREVAKATQDLRLELTELKAEKLKLENQQAVNKEDLKTAKENYEKALRDFKANPDPETKAKKESLEREAKKAQEQLSTTQADLNRLSLQMESLKTKENHAVSVSITLCAFHKAFKKFMADNSEAMIAMTSPYLDGRQLAEIESLAETLQDWANKVRDSIDNLRSQSSSAIEVEIVDYFPEIEGAS